jgi:hypothetical protein
MDFRSELDERLMAQVAAIPAPTRAYNDRITKQANTRRATTMLIPRPIPLPVPIPPLPIQRGARVLMWKQDPSVNEIGIREAFLPGRVFTGPKDARMAIQGISPPVSPNVFGDLIINPITNPNAFDAVHTFAVVRQTLTMYERHLAPKKVPWQWNTGGNVDPLNVFPHAGVTMNAFYSRNDKALKFFFFNTVTPPPAHDVFTCRSLDIVAHETGHAVLDGLKPGWLNAGNPPQTGGLHESFGDMTAIFLALSQFDLVEAIIAHTKANLHDKSFLPDLAEQFGEALGKPNGLRNADNDLKLSQVGTEVHAISQVFTGAVYDILADIFAFERKPIAKDDSEVLYAVGRYVASLVLRALIAAPAIQATFADVANKMIAIVQSDGKPAAYKTSIVNRFSVREVLAPTAKELAAHEGVEFAPGIQDDRGAVQDRTRCCGTMQHEEYLGEDESLEAELQQIGANFVKTTNGAKPTRSRSTTRKTTRK